MNFKDIAAKAIAENVSDIFIVAGLPVTGKVGGKTKAYSDVTLSPDDTKKYIEEIYEHANNRSLEELSQKGDDDFSFALRGVSRFRVNAYKQRGTLAAVIRIVRFDLPSPEELSIPEAVLSLAKRDKGLVLVTGSAGSGKSTTLACMIDKMNSERPAHIITLEDPLEFLHAHKASIISQREVSVDTETFVSALRSALRQAPDVILIGELRDSETMEIAMTAAETGHLILSSLHTIGAANTIDRIVDSFPTNGQRQILLQLSMVLQAIVSQQLIPSIEGPLIPVFEVMFCTPAIRNMIREGKVHQIDNIIDTSEQKEGMISMDKALIGLYKSGKITKQTLEQYCINWESVNRRVQ